MNLKNKIGSKFLNPITIAYIIAFGVLTIEAAVFGITSWLTSDSGGGIFNQLPAVVSPLQILWLLIFCLLRQ